LYQPQWAGRPAEPVTARDNLLAIQEIEKRLKCTCGCGLDIYTCRTTDFTCTYSPALHRDVVSLYDAGKSGQEIVDDFVRRHGVTILMAPPARGFNLTAYFVPGLLILIAGGILTFVLRRRTQRQGPAVAASAVPPTASPAELARLREELEQLDT
jgi:cytochrome c-type biogenesis protein CcmH